MNSLQPHAKSTVRGPKQIVENLRMEASVDLAFNAVCTVFALRERARQQVTINSLMITMLKEGFKFSRPQYEKVLQFLASQGIGYLDYDMKGRMRALKGIKVTLQSIGMAALSKKDGLDTFTLAPMFSKLPVNPPVAVPKKEVVESNGHKKPTRAERSYPASLTVVFETETVSFIVPNGITSAQLGSLLSSLFKADK